jgi:predicted MFS family arabinose efflux permease
LWTAALVLALWPARREADQQTEARPAQPPSRLSDWFAILADRRFWLAIVFAFVGGAAFEGVGLLLGPYLVESGMTGSEVGRFQLGALAGALAVGALLGGRISDRLGHVRVAWFSLLALVLASVSLGLAEANASDDSRAIQLALIEFVYFVVGIFTASSYALFMDLSAARWKATLFSVFMGATNACESASAFAVGQLVPAFSFSGAFIIMTLPSLLGLAILPLLRKKS